MFFNDNIRVIHNEAEVSDYFGAAADIARKLGEVYNNNSAIAYHALNQLEDAVKQGIDLDYNQLVEYATELTNDVDADDLAAKYREKAKYYAAFENAGLAGDQLGDVTIEDDMAKYMGLVFQFNQQGFLELQAM